MQRDLIERLAEYGTPPPGAASLVDVGSDRYLRFFRTELLDEIIAHGGATCRFFEGAYGSGKTHLLQLLELAGADRGMVTCRLDLSQALRLEEWDMIVRFTLQNLELRTAGGDVRGLPAILSVLGSVSSTHPQDLERAYLPHPGFKTAMVRYLDEVSLTTSGREKLAQYLAGERVGAQVLRQSGVPGVKNPLSRRNAEQVLSTVLSGLFYLGLPGTVLLFDENERTLRSTRRHSVRLMGAANLIRRFVDACFSGGLRGTLAVFAVLPGFIEEAAVTYQALGQRLRAPSIDGLEPSWRWPVLATQEVSSLRTPEEFLDAAVTRVFDLVTDSGKDDALKERMLRAGQSILEETAGTGYRRAVMKAISAHAVQQE